MTDTTDRKVFGCVHVYRTRVVWVKNTSTTVDVEGKAHLDPCAGR